MKFEQALAWLRLGNRARSEHWAPEIYIVMGGGCFNLYDNHGICKSRFHEFTTDELLTNCWEQVVDKCSHCKGSGLEPPKALPKCGGFPDCLNPACRCT